MSGIDTPQKAEQRAFQTVIDLSRGREIRPGQRLFEPELSERLKMSRTPLRNALSRLVAEGVLLKEAGKKGYLLPSLSAKDMQQVFSVRASLEGSAAELAALRWNEEELQSLRQLNWQERELYRSRQDKREYSQINEELHHRIVALSDNRYLTLLYAAFYTDGTEAGTDHPDLPSWQEHAMLLDALEARDGSRARRLMEEHVMNTYRYRAALENSGIAGSFLD